MNPINIKPNNIYSASQGPLIPNKYIIQKSPIYPIIETPKSQPPPPKVDMETKYVVHYLPLTFIKPEIPKPEPIITNVEFNEKEDFRQQCALYTDLHCARFRIRSTAAHHYRS